MQLEFSAALCIVFLLLSNLVSTGYSQVVEELFSELPVFQFGNYYGLNGSCSSTLSNNDFFRKVIHECLDNQESESVVNAVIEKFLSVVQNPSSVEEQRERLHSTGIDLPDLSIKFNICTSKLQRHADCDALDQVSLFLWPENYASAKNYGYRLEICGHYSIARSIYKACYMNSKNPGCQLHSAVAAPYFTSSSLHAQYVYLLMLRSFYRMLSPYSPEALPVKYTRYDDWDYSYSLLRELSSIPQTLGYAPGRIYELLSRAIIRHYPLLLTMHNFTQLAGPLDLPSSPLFMDFDISLEDEQTELPFAYLPAPPLNPRVALRKRLQRKKEEMDHAYQSQQQYRSDYDEDDGGDKNGGNGASNSEEFQTSTRLRIGILSASFGNTSPGVCMQTVFQYLAKQYPMTMSFIFFDRDHLPTVFAHSMRDIAVNTVNINERSVVDTVAIIAAQDLDILIHLALPTDKFGFLLGHTRLATVQILTGIGHPLTSGIMEGIDYVVLPADMLPQKQLAFDSLITEHSGHDHLHSSFSHLDTQFMASHAQVDSLACAFQAHLCADSDEALFAIYRQYESYASSTSGNSSSMDSAVEQEKLFLLKDHCQLSEACYNPAHNLLHYTEQIVVFSSMTHMMLDPISFHKPRDMQSNANPIDYESMTGFLLTPAETQHKINEKESKNVLRDETQPSSAKDRLRGYREEVRTDSVYRALHRLAKHRPVLPANIAGMSTSYFATHFLSCQQLQEIISYVLHLDELHPVFFQSSSQFGCYDIQYTDNMSNEPTSIVLVPAEYHFYYAVQFTRKMQTEMDDIFLRIIQADDKAVIIVKESYQAVVRTRLVRMYRRFYLKDKRGSKDNDDDKNIVLSDEEIYITLLHPRFAFLPSRISHEAYLGLVALSRVFLNTLPMGAGMTSAEAIAMCVPIITLPEETNVIHFADAQLKQLWSLTASDLAQMIVHNRTQYVQQAVMFGQHEEQHFHHIMEIKDRICSSRKRFFADDDTTPDTKADKNKNKEHDHVHTLNTAEDDNTNSEASIHLEERVFSDAKNRNTIGAVAAEWAQFLHRITA